MGNNKSHIKTNKSQAKGSLKKIEEIIEEQRKISADNFEMSMKFYLKFLFIS